MACGTSASKKTTPDSTSHDSGTADAGGKLGPQTDAGCPTQPAAEDDAGIAFSFGDTSFGRAFDAAKSKCDGNTRIACGNIYVHLDESGCITSLDYESDGLAEHSKCMLQALTTHCDRCEQGTTRRVYASCTIP
ncbi:MAG TPA: hypothetical protein VHM19_05225 [Polyangiales bacterium]|nr:hypothetical protein [Polyangiales bacterium]